MPVLAVRVNTELAEAAFPAHGRRLVVLEAAEAEGDPAQGMTGILTPFWARRYGRRPARKRAVKALRCAARDVGLSSREAAG